MHRHTKNIQLIEMVFECLCVLFLCLQIAPTLPPFDKKAHGTPQASAPYPPLKKKNPKAILLTCQDPRTITVKAYLITFLPVTMKKVPYQSLFPTPSTWAGMAVARLGLTGRDSKRYGVVPFYSSTFMQLLSSFSSPDEDCSKLLLELLLLCSSAMFSAFLRSPGWRHRAN